jgi:hypothetical protein
VVLDLIYGNQQTVFSIFCCIWKSQYDVKDAEQEIKETSVLVGKYTFCFVETCDSKYEGFNCECSKFVIMALQF